MNPDKSVFKLFDMSSMIVYQLNKPPYDRCGGRRSHNKFFVEIDHSQQSLDKDPHLIFYVGGSRTTLFRFEGVISGIHTIHLYSTGEIRMINHTCEKSDEIVAAMTGDAQCLCYAVRKEITTRILRGVEEGSAQITEFPVSTFDIPIDGKDQPISFSVKTIKREGGTSFSISVDKADKTNLTSTERLTNETLEAGPDGAKTD